MDFLTKNKVFFLGLIASLTVIVQQFAVRPVIDWASFGYAILMAVLAFIANEWRGAGVTITGIVGTCASVFITNNNGGHVNWQQFLMLSLAAILAAVAPPPKPQSYEDNPVIKNAKMILILLFITGIFTGCDLLKKAQAPAYDATAVSNVKTISSQTDSLYNTIADASNRNYYTYESKYASIQSNISSLIAYDSTRKHADAILVILKFAKDRFEIYRQEHIKYGSLNKAMALQYREGMSALWSILSKTENNYKP